MSSSLLTFWLLHSINKTPGSGPKSVEHACSPHHESTITSSLTAAVEIKTSENGKHWSTKLVVNHREGCH